jgi:drug/metabolite transporter (DMT)-like permease
MQAPDKTTQEEDKGRTALLQSPPRYRYDSCSNPSTTPARFRKSPLLVRTVSSFMSPRHHSLIGIIFILLGAFSFSCMFLFVKLMQGQANSFVLAFYRALVEIPIALFLCARAAEDPLGPSGNSRIRAWLWVRGGIGAAAVLCFFYAIQHLPLPDAVTLQFTTPPFAAAFAVCLAGERWKLLDAVGALVCLAGVALIAHPSWLFGTNANNTATTNDDVAASADDEDNDNDDTTVAVAVALLGAAFAGLAYTSVRKIGHKASANVMVLYYSVLSMPVTLIGSKTLLGTWNVWGGTTALTGWDWCWVLLTGLTAYAGQYLTNLGLQHETAATATLATCSQIVFTYVFELAFLHEPINALSVAGTLLIVGFMVLIGLAKMKEAEEDGSWSTVREETVVAGETEELALLFAAEHYNVRHDETRTNDRGDGV